MSAISIVCCTDHNFIMPTGVMMKSVCLTNNPDSLWFHVIVNETVKEEDKKLLGQTVDGAKVSFYKFPHSLFTQFPRIGLKGVHVSEATYYRLFLADILPKDIDRAIYLDGDIICCGSLKDLWNTDLGENAIAAIDDGDEGNYLIYNRLHYPPQYGYFNAGVLLLNLSWWREHNATKMFMDYIREHGDRILLHDQDVLNAVFYDKHLRLPFKYNVEPCYYFAPENIRVDYWRYEKEIVEAQNNPVLLHFSSLPKPWVVECDHPFKDKWLAVYHQTPWGRLPLSHSSKGWKKMVHKAMIKIGLLPPPHYHSRRSGLRSRKLGTSLIRKIGG